MDTDKHRLKTDELSLNQKLDWLIDQWCERKALHPLRYLLSAYPGILAHADQFGFLLERLRDVNGLRRSELAPEELARVIAAINEVEDLMKARL